MVRRLTEVLSSAVNKVGFSKKLSKKELEELPEEIRLYVKNLHSINQKVRANALSKLEKESDYSNRLQALPYVIKALKDPEQRVRQYAALVVLNLSHYKHTEKALPHLIPLIKDSNFLRNGVAALAIDRIVETHLEKQKPGDEHYFIQETAKRIKAAQHPKSFYKLFNDFKNGRIKHLKETDLKAYVKQLKNAEPSIKVA